MINVIHYTDTNSVEVTWLDDEGKQTRCHSYADVQMDMLESDLGADAAGYAELIATVRANIKPPAPPSPEQLAAIIEAKKQAVRALREQVLDRLAGIAGRASRRGDTVLAEACDTASEALLDITKNLPAEPDAVALTLLTRYRNISTAAIQAAPSLANAFAQVDA